MTEVKLERDLHKKNLFKAFLFFEQLKAKPSITVVIVFGGKP